MSIIWAVTVIENDTHFYTSFYIAATFLEKELNLVCFTQKL